MAALNEAERTLELLSAFGADSRNWPISERHLAQNRHAGNENAWRAAEALDAQMAIFSVTALPNGLAERIMAVAPKKPVTLFNRIQLPILTEWRAVTATVVLACVFGVGVGTAQAHRINDQQTADLVLTTSLNSAFDSADDSGA
jgi:hypothetical protein